MIRYLLVFMLILWPLWPTRAETNQTDVDLHQEFQAGHNAITAGKYKEAIDIFKRANKLQNNSCADCYINMAIAYSRLGEFPNAISSCDKAISVATNDQVKATAHAMKGTAFLSLGSADGKTLKDAEAEYRSAVQLDGNEPIFHLNLGVTLLRQSRDAEATVELQKCLSLHPVQSVADQANKLIADPRLGRESVAPDFHLTTVQGQEISLKLLRGNIVVLDFWATWCPPCRASVPELKDLTRKYANAKVVLISISADKDEKAWRDFIAKKNMDWPQYRDADNGVMKLLAVRAFPTYLVIDGDGFIKQRITGMDPQETVVHRLKATLQAMPQLEGVAAK
ncbi:MAG: redoxin domain-containing protein [Terriglobales bacterium]